MRRAVFPVLFAFLLLFALTACAEVTVTWSPEAPRKGDYVQVRVVPDREAQTLFYELSTPDERVVSGKKEDTHFVSFFRPRSEAVYTLKVTVVYGKKDEETAEVTIPVYGEAPLQEGADVIYSQKDGWWKKKSYATNTLQVAGCGIFTLSHAVQRLGFSGTDTLPDTMGKTYANCLVKGGTANERLLTQAGQVYDFITQDELNESEADIAACLRRGDFFSFSIVNGHIALADGLSEDGQKVHIVDSAPTATFERIKNGRIWYRADDGSFAEAAGPEDLPGARWFFETQGAGGNEYWLDLSYCARRGMRLIRPGWLKLSTGEGPVSVDPEYVSTMMTRVNRGDEALRVPTRDLAWLCEGAEQPCLAMVNKKSGTPFVDADGKKIPGYKQAQSGALALVLRVEDQRVYVWYKGSFGYLKKKDVELLPVHTGDFRTGTISLNGRTAGTSTVKLRTEPSAKSRALSDELKVGTPVSIAAQDGDFYLVEGRSLRGWVQSKYLTVEGEDPDGQKVDEGE